MKASTKPRSGAHLNINHLRQGRSYEATTRSGETAVGRYLGLEVAHDEWRILLRGTGGIRSLIVGELTSVLPLAA